MRPPRRLQPCPYHTFPQPTSIGALGDRPAASRSSGRADHGKAGHQFHGRSDSAQGPPRHYYHESRLRGTDGVARQPSGE